MKVRITMWVATLLLLFSTQGFSQNERYLDEIFTGVSFEDSVNYGLNYSVLPWILGATTDTIQVPLFMDIYQPMGDTSTNRPVILFGITGTFFPAYANGGFTGERNDTACVEFAKRMARRGYVVAVVQYRRGWLAGSSALNQQKTILHAAYRGIQDMNNAVRFLRANAATYGIDDSRIAVGGHGTGGYMSYGATFLDRYEQTELPKFFDFDNNAYFLDTVQFGDPTGVKAGTINNPNLPSVSSDFNVGFALGGALGDSSWVEPGDKPFIAMHCYRDPNAPFFVDDIIALDGTNGQPFAVIPSGAGGKSVVGQNFLKGNQAIFDGVQWSDPYNQRAATINGGDDGLYPFITPYTPGDAMCEGVGVPGDTLAEWTSPWTYFDQATAIGTWNFVFKDAIAAGQRDSGHVVYCQQTRGFPNDRTMYEAYMDTVVGFLSPRLAIALGLPTTTGVEDLLDSRDLRVFPNPSQNQMSINYVGSDAKPIDEIRVMDVSGRLVQHHTSVNAREFQIERGNLTTGLYLLQIRVGDKFANKKIMFE